MTDEPEGYSLPIRNRFTERFKPGKASDHIGHFETDFLSGRCVILWCRESHSQNEGHLVDQVVALWLAAKRIGAKVVGIFRFVVRGYVGELEWQARISEVAGIAKKHDAIILATETNRLVRNEMVRCNGPELWNLQPTEMELCTLGRLTAGVDLMTLAHPDANPSDERSEQTIRGRSIKKRGRNAQGKKEEKKVDKRKRLMPIADSMRKAGFSVRKIAEYLGVPKSTTQEWTSKPPK